MYVADYEFEMTLDGRDVLVFGSLAMATVHDVGRELDPEVWFNVHDYDHEAECYADEPRTYLPRWWGPLLMERLWDEAQARYETAEEKKADGR